MLAHDWLVGMRGGEWVLDRLARLFGPTDLYTLVNDGRFLTDAIAACNVITSPLQRLPGARGRLRRWYLPLMPWAVQRLRVRPDARLLISTSSAVMKAIVPPRVGGCDVPHLCYCHSPARYIWEQSGDYRGGSRGGLRALGLRLARKRFQEWDRRTAQVGGRVTKFIANSEHTRRRIERCYEREAAVIHPPVRTEFYTPDESVKREPWLLVVAALEPYKRTELVIEAAKRGGWPLKVVGTGSQQSVLRALADRSGRGNVEFLGRVDDQMLRDLYRRARCLVFPQVEDFGIIAAEAQACGCPVAAYAGGGAMEIVTEHTGTFMREQSAEAIVAAVAELQGRRIDWSVCRANAMRFSEARFDRQILDEVDALLEERASPSR